MLESAVNKVTDLRPATLLRNFLEHIFLKNNSLSSGENKGTCFSCNYCSHMLQEYFRISHFSFSTRPFKAPVYLGGGHFSRDLYLWIRIEIF